MNQIDKEQALKPFLREVLNSDLSSEQDKAVLYVMAALMEEVESSGENERAVHIEQDSDGRFSAYSEKLANLQLRDISVWMQILAKAVPIASGVHHLATTGSVDAVKLAGGILAILGLMRDKKLIRKDFNEQDAKILYAISKIIADNSSTMAFAKQRLLDKLNELGTNFSDQFNIDQDSIDESLAKFVRYGVLEVQDGNYVVREKIKPLRQK